MESPITKGFALVGVAALFGFAAQKAIDEIIANVDINSGMPVLDYNTPPANPLNPNEVYVRLDLPVTITNMNPFPLGISSFDGVVKYGNITLTTINLPYGIWAYSGGTATVNVDVDIPCKRVYDDIGNALSNGNFFSVILNKIMLSGNVHVTGKGRGVSIPIENIPIPIV